MKRPLQLSLAITLALGGTNALALGLGPVHVKSKLNQPLDAEIPIIQGTAGEAEGLLVNLAAAEDFERVGINRSHLGVPLEFNLVKGSNGEMVIKVTSKDIVRDTYLDFLVEANWPKGRLLREYTVLLDPPLTAPARGATTSAVAAAPSTVTVKKHEAPPQAAPTSAPSPSPRAKPAPSAVAAAPARKTTAGEYGPVAAGETLSGVAQSTKVSGTNIDQMMLALLKNNPNAFYKDNVNALKRGAILRVPSQDEVKAIGSASEAAAQVHAQIEDWRGGRASPTRVADAGGGTTPAPGTIVATAPKTPKASAASKAADEHLALVPPKVGKDSVAMADRPGSGAGSAAATSELKSELARTKETLTTREQEAGELKSRVKELEDLKGKNDRMIGLKNSEIAELQDKLKQLQEKSAAGATKPSAAPTALPPTTTSTAAAPVVATPATTPATTSTASAATTPTPAPKASTALAAASTTKIDKQDIWGDAGGTSTTAPLAATKSAPAVTTPANPTTASTAPANPAAASMTPANPAIASTTPEPVSTTTPLPGTPPTTSGSAAASSPAVTTPVPNTTTPTPTKTASTVKAQPTPVAALWYEAPWVKPAALGAGVLLLLGGVLGLRRRNAAPAAGGRGSIADSFGQSPLKPGSGAAGSQEEEEASLREQLQLDPSNVGLHLELLSLYYAERDVARFEDAAADMQVYVEDGHQPEWLEAQAMGQELAPHNPLFSGVAHFDDSDAAIASAHADTVERPRFDDEDEFVTAPSLLHQPAGVHASAPLEDDIGFNVGHNGFGATPVPATNSVAKHDEGFDFTLPPLDLDAPVSHTPPPAAPLAADLDDDYFPGDDAIGTKLDLAKAYMDMGDPEGARSMLEEVVAEGSDAQKAEAHRLIAEIR
jgi:pilus assembly protein FimV